VKEVWQGHGRNRIVEVVSDTVLKSSGSMETIVRLKQHIYRGKSGRRPQNAPGQVGPMARGTRVSEVNREVDLTEPSA